MASAKHGRGETRKQRMAGDPSVMEKKSYQVDFQRFSSIMKFLSMSHLRSTKENAYYSSPFNRGIYGVLQVLFGYAIRFHVIIFLRRELVFTRAEIC